MTSPDTLAANDASASHNQRDASLLRTEITELIGDDLARSMSVYDDELACDSPAVADILAHTANFRGKQLRPTLLLLTAKAVGEVNESHHVLAAVIEMVHVATLLHDDVLDEADIRRHVATVNRRWNNESSVLFGDFLFTHAFHLAASVESTHACRRIGDASNRLCTGELTQISHRGNMDLDEATYLDIIDRKTAELCAVATELGAHYAGADEPAIEACTNYGRDLGIAFQIADDLLDLIGQPDEAGKTLGTDLEKQKLTLPLIHMLARVGDADRRTIRRQLENPDESTRAAIEPYLQETGSLDYAAETARGYARAAQQSLAAFPESRAKTLLQQTAEVAANRRF